MGQRTFTLIPKCPGRDDSPDKPPIRPMTSKQVRNAYKAANKGPKLSRAEAWKQEKAEQERIRKEFEREKAAAKAKVARDKKKEKELAEKEAKRKKGLPLINVRPSQETISWFVRGNGSAKKRDAQGRNVKNTDATDDKDNDNDTAEEMTTEDEIQQPAVKSQKLGSIKEGNEDISDAGMKTITENEPPKPCIESPYAKDHDEEKEDDIAKITGEARAETEAIITAPQQLFPEIELDGMDDELDADFEEDLALGILEDIEAAMNKSKSKKSHDTEAACGPPNENLVIPAQLLDDARRAIPNRYAEDLGLQRPAPSSFAKPALPREPPHNLEPPSPSPPRQEPPMSTQAILFNLDDFFPSSSQQVRELEEELDDDLMPSAPLQLAPIAEEEEFSDAEAEKSPEPPLPTLDPAPNSPPPVPRRFFTSSGSHERMCLAIQRSRRTAELEKIQRCDRSRYQAGMVQKAQAKSRKSFKPRESMRKPPVFSKPPLQGAQCHQPRQPLFGAAPVLHERPNTNTTPAERVEAPVKHQYAPLKTTHALYNKPTTNAHTTLKRPEPEKQPPSEPPQESKENQKPPQEPFALSASQESYGGEWVDDLAIELMI
ncbi:hypothetical protein F53441_6613 [Fusarium austroafricanum]|uniref:Uncharacterized protein n=1 Tax=Fusarium austroafricanum TaxID=2364996 RepID=A0A8H4NWG7_9HYPO|nr:hypothetical protein F53441_6613 [Fusarium austroafricanum]